MKKTILKYLTLITTLASAILMFFKWFTISIPGLEAETHSFFTIPKLITDASGVLSTYAGKSSTVMIILLGGILEYMCVLSAGLSVCGIWKNCIREKKSRFIFSGQIISLCLHFLAALVMLGANTIFNSILGISNLIYPTIWYALSFASPICSLLCLRFFNIALVSAVVHKKNDRVNTDDTDPSDEQTYENE